MKKHIAALLCILAVVFTMFAANLVSEVSGRTTRYRGGSVITLDNTASVQDDGGAWSLTWARLRSLSYLTAGTNYQAGTIAGTNVTALTNANNQVTISATLNGLTTNVAVLTSIGLTNTFRFTNGLLRTIE